MKQIILPALLFLIVAVITGFLISELSLLNRVFDPHIFPADRLEAVEEGDLKLTKIEVEQDGETRIIRYVTVLSISRPALYGEQVQVLQTSDHAKPISDLSGHPSFLIQDNHERFWKSQFLMLKLFSSGGAFLYAVLAGAFAWVYFREGEKYFTRDIKRIIHGFCILVLAGIVLYTIFYGRMVLFLNNEFNMNEPLLSGLSEMYNWTFLLLAVLFLYAFIEKAIPIQEEHDLTV